MTMDDSKNETKQDARRHPRSGESVRDSEEWLFMTLESIGDAVIATDAQGRVVFMNKVAVQLTGWSEQEAEGHDCREVFHIVNETAPGNRKPGDEGVERWGHLRSRQPYHPDCQRWHGTQH